MTNKERDAAKLVFHDSINFSKVRVQDDTGLGGSPWTSPPTPWGQYWVMHVGTTLYTDLAKNQNRKTVMIHELTHVWQGQHGVPYVSNSAAHQAITAILNGGKVAKVYHYTAGGPWRYYSCEQQASIVDDWFRDGCMWTHPNWVYIKENIRPAAPWM
jgi:type VI secretion system secreted protein VgrG